MGCCQVQALVLMNLTLLQISSAMSRPEEAPAQVLATDASEAYTDAASMLTPDEALHSIHEEPDEGMFSLGARALPSADRRPSAACPDDLQHGSSRGASFMQPALGIDRQSTQPSLPSGAPRHSPQPSLSSCLVCSRPTLFMPSGSRQRLSHKLSSPEAWRWPEDDFHAAPSQDCLAGAPMPVYLRYA